MQESRFALRHLYPYDERLLVNPEYNTESADHYKEAKNNKQRAINAYSLIKKEKNLYASRTL